MKEHSAMSKVRTGLVGSAVLAAVSFVSVRQVRAQGCVASRMSAPNGCSSHNGMKSLAMDADGTSYYLPKGRWQSSFGYRWFRSHRHFVGDVEQNGKPPAERDRRANEVINHTHIPALSLSYGVNDRLSASADLPILIARRKNPANATRPLQRTDARGIGDLVLMGRYWVGHPSGASPQNVSFGLGFKLPTGKEDLQDDVLVMNTTTRQMESVMRPVDQSIQPGDGGFGFVTEFQGFKGIGEATVFASGSYLFNPRVTNGVPTNRGRANEAIMSVADQYAARVGVGVPVPFQRKIGFSLSARLEGVPVEDLIGSSEGFRRPGYSIGIEPGLSYTWKRNAVSVSVPYLVRRVRTQSYPDKLESETRGEHVQGDAAFADYIVIVGFSRRF
jgi:hypothetical protein